MYLRPRILEIGELDALRLLAMLGIEQARQVADGARAQHRQALVAIAGGLLVVALAYLVSLPQNNYHPCDLLEPTYAGDADLGYWMVDKYDQEVDVYHLLVVMEHPNGTFEWLDGDGIWLPRRAVEGTFNVIGSFDRRKAHL